MSASQWSKSLVPGIIRPEDLLRPWNPGRTTQLHESVSFVPGKKYICEHLGLPFDRVFVPILRQPRVKLMQNRTPTINTLPRIRVRCQPRAAKTVGILGSGGWNARFRGFEIILVEVYLAAGYAVRQNDWRGLEFLLKCNPLVFALGGSCREAKGSESPHPNDQAMFSPANVRRTSEFGALWG